MRIVTMIRVPLCCSLHFRVLRASVVIFCLTTCWMPCRTDDRLLRAEKIVASEDSAEFAVQIQATAPGTSWQDAGRECALVKVMLDGRYDQHLFLLGDARETQYEFLVGPLAKGEHRLEFFSDDSWTPELQEKSGIQSFKAILLNRSDPSQEPLLRAPILHLRKDTVGRFSDVPLVLYWDSETSPSRSPRVVYTVIFSNEDGGTDTERLMARWGRTTDIEWCFAYSRSGNDILEEFQGRDHETTPFRGRKEGEHPILYDLTTNNNFADTLEAPLPCRVRLLPFHADLRGKSRESIMDRFPWTYAIMAGEMLREGKTENPGDAGTAKLSDLRNYAYFEICSEQRGTEMYFDIQLKSDGRFFRSDHGDPQSGISRSGCVRSTVELPPGTRAQDLRALRIHCRPAPVAEGGMPVRFPGATVTAVPKLFLLDENYFPGPNLMDRKLEQKLKPGESLTLELPGEKRKMTNGK